MLSTQIITNEQKLSILAITDKQKLSTLSITNIKEQLTLIIGNILSSSQHNVFDQHYFCSTKLQIN